MIARYHYDDLTYHKLLDSNLAPTEELEVTEHLENCDACQTRLESIVQSDQRWSELKDFLRHDPVGDAATTMSLEFLRESDYPGALGRFGRFEIVEVLGSGGMGVVLKGYDRSLNRYSAIKVLAPHLASSGAARQRFSREAKSAAAVVHEHVVPIQTVDEENGLPYFVMPVIDGQSLQQRVHDRGPLTVTEVLRIGRQIAEGLAAAHAQGLVHRDIKPANVMLENGVERVQLTDFGLARAADDATMTQSGVLAGTPQYMSPEQARGEEIDHRSDLFSLGSVLYFMCTARSPFRAETTVGVIHRVTSEDPRPPRSINHEVPAWLEAIILKLLSKEKASRFESAADVAKLLEKWLTHLQNPESPAPERIKSSAARFKWPPVSRWFVAIAAGGLFALLATVIVLETSKGTIYVETNDDAEIPIRIRKGDKIVDELVVRAGEAFTRVYAGQYVVELVGNDVEFEIIGGEINLARNGVGVAKIVRSKEKASGVINAVDFNLPAASNDDPNAARPTSMEVAREREIKAGNLVLLFTKPNCEECDAIAPAIKKLFKQGYVIVERDLSADPEFARQHGVLNAPALAALHERKVQAVLESARCNEPEVTAFVQQYLQPLSATAVGAEPLGPEVVQTNRAKEVDPTASQPNKDDETASRKNQDQEKKPVTIEADAETGIIILRGRKEEVEEVRAGLEASGLNPNKD